MSNSRKIIEYYESNGGLDYHFVESQARSEGYVNPRDYFYLYVKSFFDVHGNTARAVVRYFY